MAIERQAFKTLSEEKDLSTALILTLEKTHCEDGPQIARHRRSPTYVDDD